MYDVQCRTLEELTIVRCNTLDAVLFSKSRGLFKVATRNPANFDNRAEPA